MTQGFPTSQRFEELSTYIRCDMQLSHIYQPIMLIELLNRNGEAGVGEIAEALAKRDVSQIEYYEERVKRMVGPVLTKSRGLTEYIRATSRVNKGSYRLKGFDSLTDSEIRVLIGLCKDKIESYTKQRGDNIWSHRRKSRGYISGSIKWEVIKRAKERCEACGVSRGIKAIEVDHIIPRNLDGTNDIFNLQALCYSCNAMKRDRDATDFRGVAESYKTREVGCVFCQVDEGRVKAANELCYVVDDLYPATEHHTLIIPKRHVPDFFDLYQPEINAVYNMLGATKKELEALDKTITGFNVGTNVGKDAGQSVFHAHMHLIPRRSEDVNKTTNNPRGGVRWAIPQN